MSGINGFPIVSAEEAAAAINHGDLVGFSAFTPAGAAKAVPRALAVRAAELHSKGEEFRIRVVAGASTGDAIDGALARANAVSWRAPYQSSKELRKRINAQETEFLDIHLSHLGQMIHYGFLGKIDVAVVEAVDVTRDGRIYLSASEGITPTVLAHAKKVYIELNRAHSSRLIDMHDVAVLPRPPKRSPIPIHNVLDKIGKPFVSVDPSVIAGVIETDELDGVAPFTPPDERSDRIAGHVVKFLLDEYAAGRIPSEFLPLQAGVGNVANAVMSKLGAHPDIPPFDMYTEVMQDSLVDLMKAERLMGVSTSALTLSDACLKDVYANMDFFAPRIVIRPTEISNHPGVVRRLGVISINTVLEMDIYGCANSTHVCGGTLMNGIGGSGDFTRNSYLSLLVAPSIAKGGAISAVVPMCSHVDHNEHSVQVLVTDQGLADLRGKGPIERAHEIIEKCAHPAYRPYLREYIETAPMGHLRHDLSRCFELHRNLQTEGSMLPGVEVGV